MKTAAKLLWSFDAQMPIAGAFAPGPGGQLYFTTADGILHAFDASGRERWQRVSGTTAPVVSDNGTVFALGPGASLYALSPEGRPLWTVQLGSAGGPLAASGDTVFIQTDGELSAVVAPGLVQWSVPAASQFTEASAAPDGGIIAGANGGGVIAVSPDGAVRWRFMPEGGLAGAITIGGNRVYAGSASGTIYALDVDSGSQLWQLDTSQAVGGGPVAGASGLVFFDSDALYAVRSDGAMAWRKAVAQQDLRAPLAADGLGGVIAPAPDGGVVMLNADGTVRWSTRSFGQVQQAAVSSSGILFVATSDGHVCALQ
jgi:outer membrane protein assembly factor BamB